MAQDNKVIASLSPTDLVALLRETAGIAVLESAVADGKPIIQVAVKAVNAQTGEVLAGGLPFSIVMFKAANETGYSNIAIGTVVPVTELDIHLPRDFFNICNQRLRFVRVFPLDASSFVIQMDLVLRNATREYVKFNVGLWGMLFKQVLFDLIGSSADSLAHATAVYAETNIAQHVVSTLAGQDAEESPASVEPTLGEIGETALASEIETAVPQAAITEVVAAAPLPVAEVEPLELQAVVTEDVATATLPEEGDAAEEGAPLSDETATAHEEAPEMVAADPFEGRSENVMMTADPAEGKDEAEPLLPSHNDSEPFAVTLLDSSEHPADDEAPKEAEPLMTL